MCAFEWVSVCMCEYEFRACVWVRPALYGQRRSRSSPAGTQLCLQLAGGMEWRLPRALMLMRNGRLLESLRKTDSEFLAFVSRSSLPYKKFMDEKPVWERTKDWSTSLCAFLLHHLFFCHWAQAWGWIRPPGAEDSLKLTTRHYALRTKGRANPTCSLFTAAVGLLLCAFWPLRGGPLTRELNYHGNSHRQAQVSLSLSFALALSAQWDILTQRKTFHRKHTTPNMFLYCAIVLALKFSLSSFSFFSLPFFTFSIPPSPCRKRSPWMVGLKKSFRLSKHVRFKLLLIERRVQSGGLHASLEP